MHELRFTLRQLAYFLAVSELGSIAAAAQQCHVSQTAVSLGITDLERVLGVQLILRKRAKGVVLTSEGRRLVVDARSLLSQADHFQSGVEAGRSAVRGRITIGCYTTLSPIVMPRLLADLLAMHPDLVIDMEENAQPELEQGLLSGQIDVAIMYDHGVGAALAKMELARLTSHVILPREHPMAAAASVSLKELAAEPMILFDVSPSREDWQALVDDIGLDPHVAFRTRSFELTRCMVGLGFGYSVLVQRPRISGTYSGESVLIKPIRERVRSRAVVVAHPAGTRLSANANAVVDHCRRALPGYFTHSDDAIDGTPATG